MKSSSDRSEKKILREFGLLTGTIFVLIFGVMLPWLLEIEFPLWPWIIAAVLIIFSLLQPLVLGPVYKIWMAVGSALGWVNTRIILGLVFYIVVTPIGLIMRLFGNDPMERKFTNTLTSYRKQSKRTDNRHMEKPF
jgi:predicted membrane protein